MSASYSNQTPFRTRSDVIADLVTAHRNCNGRRAVRLLWELDRLTTGRRIPASSAARFLISCRWFDLDADTAIDAVEEWEDGTFRPEAYR